MCELTLFKKNLGHVEQHGQVFFGDIDSQGDQIGRIFGRLGDGLLSAFFKIQK
jgi:hypothetical protein